MSWSFKGNVCQALLYGHLSSARLNLTCTTRLSKMISHREGNSVNCEWEDVYLLLCFDSYNEIHQQGQLLYRSILFGQPLDCWKGGDCRLLHVSQNCSSEKVLYFVFQHFMFLGQRDINSKKGKFNFMSLISKVILIDES